LAATIGVAGVLAASATAFTVLKLAGAVYLVYLGLKSIRHAGAGALGGLERERRPPLPFGMAARQGLLTNLLNPKAALFFTALLPQFLSTDGWVLGQSAVMTLIASAASLGGLTVYAFAFNRGARLMELPSVRRALDRLTGAVLVALGVRIALERR
jgi:threonine/homoserine/homoserine lactone efflux protein